MQCPRDQIELEKKASVKYVRHRCPLCEGQLLGKDEVLDASGADLSRLLGDKLAAMKAGTLRCPHDGEAMRTVRHNGVEIDVCPGCQSLWLDAGEISRVVARRSRATAAAAGVAAGAAVTAAAASPASQSSLGSSVAEAVIDVAGDVVIDIVGDLIGSLFS